MYRLAINGYGRIGRSVIRALHDRQQQGLNTDLVPVMINEPADAATIAHLTRFDSTHGRFQGEIAVKDRHLLVDGTPVLLTHHETLQDHCWQDIDLLLECSGRDNTREDMLRHLDAGAKRVLLSHPGPSDVDCTVVYGVNHERLTRDHRLISNASCTTNGSVPVIKCILDHFGIEALSITTIHSAMNDQPVIDAYHHTDLRKTRSASQSMIPVDTELAKGIVRFLPELTGRICAQAIRIPTVNVSAMDMSIQLSSSVTVEAVNAVLADFAGTQPDVIGFNTEPLASIDFNHDARSCIMDGTQTRVASDKLLKLFVWFDNEWSFAHRMIDVAAHIQAQSA